MYGIYKSYEPLLTKKTLFEVKHCKIETVILSRSAQAAELKKTYIWFLLQLQITPTLM